MQSHWKTIQWLTLAALAAFVVALMAGSYAMTYGVLVSAFVVVTSYLISVAGFEAQTHTK